MIRKQVRCATSPHHRMSTAFTTVETMITALILTLVLAGVSYALQRSLETFEQSQATGDLNSRATRAMQRIVNEVMGARASTLAPQSVAPFSSDSIEFERPVDVAGGLPIWGPRRRLELQLGAGEVDNGMDDDGDGLVDERAVFLVLDPGGADESSSLIINGVRELLAGETANAADDNGNGLDDEPGLAFNIEEDRLVIRMTIQRTSPDGTLLTITQEASVMVRNRWEP